MTDIRESVAFGTGGDRGLHCDVYTPGDLDAPAPAVLLLHGGAWRMGSRAVMRGYAECLAAKGYVGVASEYRLTPESAWPAQIHDVKAALRWMRTNASELGIDPERIAVLGRSAGGHLALLAAGTPDHPDFEGNGGNPGAGTSVAAAVGIFPPTTFFTGEARPRGGTPARALMGEIATDELARAASPLTYSGPGYPPTFLLHGGADKVVPPSASIVMYEALVDAGVPVEMHMYADQPHGFAGREDFLDLCAGEIAHFLDRYLQPSPAELEAAGTR